MRKEVDTIAAEGDIVEIDMEEASTMGMNIMGMNMVVVITMSMEVIITMNMVGNIMEISIIMKVVIIIQVMSKRVTIIQAIIKGMLLKAMEVSIMKAKSAIITQSKEPNMEKR